NLSRLHCAMEFHVDLIGRRDLSGQIYRQMRRAIANGRLRPGDCLPASRDLAESLGVSRITVTVTYDRLAGEGFLVTRVGAGTYVSKHVALAQTESGNRKVEGTIRPRSLWESIRLRSAFAQAAQFDFRTGL